MGGPPVCGEGVDAVSVAGDHGPGLKAGGAGDVDRVGGTGRTLVDEAVGLFADGHDGRGARRGARGPLGLAWKLAGAIAGTDVFAAPVHTSLRLEELVGIEVRTGKGIAHSRPTAPCVEVGASG